MLLKKDAKFYMLWHHDHLQFTFIGRYQFNTVVSIYHKHNTFIMLYRCVATCFNH